MRTTITLDDDVAILLKRAQRASKQSFKEVVNAALRAGLAQLERPAKPRLPYAVRPLAVGRSLLGNIDDVAEALAVAEGEAFR
jgi:hypothetical protein